MTDRKSHMMVVVLFDFNEKKNHTHKNGIVPDLVVHAFHCSTWETEAGGISMRSRLAWSTASLCYIGRPC